MRTSIRQRIRKFIIEYSKYNHWHKVAVCMAAIVAVLTVSALVLPAVTMGHSAYCGKEEHTHTNECYKEQLICGYEEGSGTAHVHDDSCYTEEKELICPLEETPGHTHTQDCISTERQLVCGNEEPEHEHTSECYEVTETYICGQEESAGHTHTDECYKVNKVLTCTADESKAAHQHTDACYEKVLVCTKEEHTHTLICYSDPTADVESRQTWEQTMAKVELSGDWSEDVIAIAQSQLGYHESKTNYIVNTVDGEEVMKGYSRYGEWYSSAYGEWYGDTYADWSGMFVSFCLYYAGIPDNQFIWDADCSRWMTSLSKANLYGSAGQYTPVQGDIVFLDYDKDGTVDHAGIVEKVNDKEIGTIEGDSEDSVSRRTYKLTDDKLMGYGILPEEPANAENLQDGSNWQNVQKDTIVNENDKLKFSLSYEIPSGELSQDCKTVVYQLPDNILTVQASSGEVENSSKQKVGTYVIDMDENNKPQIKITFYDDYVTGNSEQGMSIDGKIIFNSSVDQIKKEDDGSVKLPFKDGVEVEFNVEDNGQETEDLQVTKSQSEIDPSTGTVKYTIKVSSENGTSDSIILKDVMNQLALENGTFTVEDKSGNTVTGVQTPNAGVDNFELTLPSLEPDGEYTITYTAKLKSELVN